MRMAAQINDGDDIIMYRPSRQCACTPVTDDGQTVNCGDGRPIR